MRARRLALFTPLLLAACTSGDEHPQPQSPGTSPELELVRAQVDAFNRHDVEAMIARVAPDFVWLSVAGDSVTVEARGRGALAEGMRGYFASVPSARSEIEASTVAGPFVAIRERASWTDESGRERSQVSLGVWEVRDGLIRRAWYYPAVEPRPWRATTAASATRSGAPACSSGWPPCGPSTDTSTLFTFELGRART